MNNPKFTILMPVYNREDLCLLFDRAVESVFSNSVRPDDFVLVVDGPVSGDFESKIFKYKNKYNIRPIWLTERVGLTKALNIGLDQVSTEWTFRADGDDYNKPNRFSEQIRLIKCGYDLIGGSIREVDGDGNYIATKSAPVSEEAIREYAKYRNPFNHMTVAFRTSLVKKCGGYPDVYLKEDYALWALLLEAGAKVVNSEKTLVDATTGSGMYARRGGWKYVLSECYLQAHLVRCGIKGWGAAVAMGIFRSIIFIMPSLIRGRIYESFLRSR